MQHAVLIVLLFVTVLFPQGTYAASAIPESVFSLAGKYGPVQWNEKTEDTIAFSGSMGNVNYLCIFPDCKDGTCHSLMLRSIFAGYSVDEAFTNAFNKETKAGKAYLNDNALLVFDFFLPMTEGLSGEMIKASLEWFQTGLADLIARLEPKKEQKTIRRGKKE